MVLGFKFRPGIARISNFSNNLHRKILLLIKIDKNLIKNKI